MENKELVGENCVVYFLTILCTKLVSFQLTSNIVSIERNV